MHLCWALQLLVVDRAGAVHIEEVEGLLELLDLLGRQPGLLLRGGTGGHLHDLRLQQPDTQRSETMSVRLQNDLSNLHANGHGETARAAGSRRARDGRGGPSP